jgi:hypothetical protein
MVRGSGFRAKGKGLRVARSWFLVQGSWLRDRAKGKALRVAGYGPVKYDGAFNPDGIDRKINSIGQAG